MAMGLTEDSDSLFKFEAAAGFDKLVSKVVLPCVLERLPVHNQLVQEVKLLLRWPSPKVVLFQTLLDELFHLEVIEDQLIDVFEDLACFTILLHCFKKVTPESFVRSWQKF